jgi:hypothetical protein
MGCFSSKAEQPKIKTGNASAAVQMELQRMKLAKERIELSQREDRESMWTGKADLSKRVKTENMMDGECVQIESTEASDLSIIKQKEEVAVMNEAALKAIKKGIRRLAKRKAEKERKWMVFSDVDYFDETEMANLASFLTTVIDKVPSMKVKYNNEKKDISDCITVKKRVSCGNDIADYLSSTDVRERAIKQNLNVSEEVDPRTSDKETNGQSGANIIYDLNEDGEEKEEVTSLKRTINIRHNKDVKAAVVSVGLKSQKDFRQDLKFNENKISVNMPKRKDSKTGGGISVMRRGSSNSEEFVQVCI